MSTEAFSYVSMDKSLCISSQTKLQFCSCSEMGHSSRPLPFFFFLRGNFLAVDERVC